MTRTRSRTLVAFTVAFCLVPALAHAQLSAELGPRGEVTKLRVGGVVYLEDIGLSVVKPGWAGHVVDQHTVEPGSLRVEKTETTTVYTGTLVRGAYRFGFHETARVLRDRLVLDDVITPLDAVDAETVLVHATMPAAGHAGQTRYLVSGPEATRGVCPREFKGDPYVLFGGRTADWVGFMGEGAAALRVVPGTLGVQFQDDRKWNTPGFGFLATAEGGRLAAGKPIHLALTFLADTPAQLEADARKASQSELAGLRLGDDRPLAIGNVAPDRRSVETFSTVELTAEVAATYQNPFDPDQIKVDAEVTRPEGSRLTVPGFFDVPMKQETLRGAERLVVAGAAGFRIRYAPTTAGNHRLVVVVTDRSGTVRSAPVELTATAGKSPGFVRVAKAAPRSFAFDNGQPYFAVGENLCWATGRAPLARYTSWLEGLGSAGGNWARLWLSFNEKGLEWMPAPTPKAGTGHYLGLGRYAFDNAARLDEVLRLARANGVYLMFCLGTYGEFTDGGYFGEGSWVSNPYNAKNGGPCARPDDFWTSAEAKRLYQRRLRYLVARWGASTNLFAWEFWNEVPPTRRSEPWVAEMAAYLKRIDPYHHLVSTTYGASATWNCPQVDFTMTHMYGQAGNSADFTAQIAREARVQARYPKPYLLAEFGIDWQTGDERWDRPRSGLNMHNGAWAAMMSGAAGTAMLWYWDGYVHPSNLYHVLTPLRKFSDAVDWAKTPFKPLPFITLEQAGGQAETFTDLTIPATLEWGRLESGRYTVGHDGQLTGGTVAMTIGSPHRGDGTELFSKLTWHLDMPRAGKVVARLGQVCSRAHLQVAVDGQVRLDRTLETGAPGTGPWKSAKHLDQWNVWVSDYAEDLAIEVPAGRHDLTFANTDGDWLQIRSLTLPGYRSSRYPWVHALGLASDRLLLLWVHNRESTWRTEYDGKTPSVLRELRARVPAPAGTWRVAWWDTFKGTVIRSDEVTADHGTLVLTVPDLAADLAARVEKAGP